MNILAYFRDRLKPMTLGFVVGFILGYLRAIYFEPDIQPDGRWILAVQIGFAFSVLALFIMNYLELRQRIIKKADDLREQENLTKLED